MTQDVIQTHYQRVARSYNRFLHYSPEFVRCLTSKMIEKLRLTPEDRLVDLGCGTGMYSLDILEQVPLRRPIIGVDPFPEMLAHIPPEAPIVRLELDALEFASRPGTYDKVLVKETVHHIEDRKGLFARLRERLAPGGVLLLVHVPPDIRYPLFRKALDRCRRWHANPDELVQLLEGAGFEVEREGLDYRHAIPKSHYFDMVKGQYMSVLSSFTQEEIEEGLREMAQTYQDREVLEFIDHFDYIAARKP